MKTVPNTQAAWRLAWPLCVFPCLGESSDFLCQVCLGISVMEILPMFMEIVQVWLICWEGCTGTFTNRKARKKPAGNVEMLVWEFCLLRRKDWEIMPTRTAKYCNTVTYRSFERDLLIKCLPYPRRYGSEFLPPLLNQLWRHWRGISLLFLPSPSFFHFSLLSFFLPGTWDLSWDLD